MVNGGSWTGEAASTVAMMQSARRVAYTEDAIGHVSKGKSLP
jgi:hypothetical protein